MPKTSAPFDFSKPVAYDEAAKHRFHTAARRQLRQLAEALGLEPSAYGVRCNRAGVAVSGEIILHAAHLYVQVSQSALGAGHGVLFRTCNGPRDFTGGVNHFAPLDLLTRPSALARRIQETLHV